MVHMKSVPLSWRRYESRYRLVGSKCTTCGSLYFPVKSICPKCRRRGNLEKYQFKGEGKVYSYTIIRSAPSGFEKRVPYIIGIIELDEGVKVTGEIVGDLALLDIGARVKAVFRKIYEDGDDGVIHYGLKWELV